MMKQEPDIDNKNFFSEADALNIFEGRLIGLINEKVKNPAPFQDEICKAIMTYDFLKLKQIIQHEPVYKKHILLAIALKNSLGLQLLLEARANPNEISNDHQTTLLLYAIEFKYFEGVRLLLQYSHTDHLAPEVVKMLTRKLFSEKIPHPHPTLIEPN